MYTCVYMYTPICVKPTQVISIFVYTPRFVSIKKLSIFFAHSVYPPCLEQPVMAFSKHKPANNIAATASLIAALIAALLIIILLVALTVILYKRKRLYGGFYILSVPPSPDYFKKLDPTRPLSEQTSKLPYFPEWEYPRNKIRLSEWCDFHYILS